MAEISFYFYACTKPTRPAAAASAAAMGLCHDASSMTPGTWSWENDAFSSWRPRDCELAAVSSDALCGALAKANISHVLFLGDSTAVNLFLAVTHGLFPPPRRSRRARQRRLSEDESYYYDAPEGVGKPPTGGRTQRAGQPKPPPMSKEALQQQMMEIQARLQAQQAQLQRMQRERAHNHTWSQCPSNHSGTNARCDAFRDAQRHCWLARTKNWLPSASAHTTICNYAKRCHNHLELTMVMVPSIHDPKAEEKGNEKKGGSGSSSGFNALVDAVQRYDKRWGAATNAPAWPAGSKAASDAQRDAGSPDAFIWGWGAHYMKVHAEDREKREATYRADLDAVARWMVQQYGRRSGAPSRGTFFTQLRPYMVRKPKEYQDQDQCATARMNRVAVEVMGRHSIGVLDGFELTRGAEADHAVDGTHYDYAVLQVQGLLHLNALIQPRSQIGGRPRAIDGDGVVREACRATASPPPPPPRDRMANLENRVRFS